MARFAQLIEKVVEIKFCLASGSSFEENSEGISSCIKWV